MYTPTVHQLDADLERVMRCIQDLRRLDYSVETGRQQALAEAVRLLGAVARYRHRLQHLDARSGRPRRQAA